VRVLENVSFVMKPYCPIVKKLTLPDSSIEASRQACVC
jgi:hypothetical protein